MLRDLPVLDTRVLAIASHVTYGYVGNKMATFVMQALGCDVSAINTVHFSNHTAYKQFTGRKVSADEIQELYQGLKKSDLNHFDMMLSGYIASKDAVEAVGAIGRDLKLKANIKPGSFFWILDPVMGDEGRLYVSDDIVPAYKSLCRDADLIVPNSFEAELLSETKITDMKSLIVAITKMHKEYRIPHIIVTSLHISPKTGRRFSNAETIAVVGSSCRTDFTPRIFSVTVPALPIFFSGTGDMFAALTLARLRQAVISSPDCPDLICTKSWQPPDEVPATSLPLAKATEMALASMHTVLQKTAEARSAELGVEKISDGVNADDEGAAHLRRTRASEVRVVRYAEELINPTVMFQAQDVELPPHELPGDNENCKEQ